MQPIMIARRQVIQTINPMMNDIREKFRAYLNDSGVKDAERWLSVVDFGLKVLLQAVGELKEDQEVYDVTDLERVDKWRDMMRSEQAWQHIDRQNHNEPSKALRHYRKYIEALDTERNSIKRFAPSKPADKSDDTETPLPGITVSKSRNSILIDSDRNPDISEGEAMEAHVTRYERSRLARQLCIEAYGSTYRCEVCGLRLADRYGHRKGKADYIEVHHIIGHADSSRKKGSHGVNYRDELIPLCPNCHRMIHHLKDHTIHPDELRNIIAENERKG